MKGVKTVFIGVILNKKNLAGKPFRTDIGGSYHKLLSGAIYQCRINGAWNNRYFFVEERYYVEQSDGTWKLGNIKKIHHYNQTPEQLQIK